MGVRGTFPKRESAGGTTKIWTGFNDYKDIHIFCSCRITVTLNLTLCIFCKNLDLVYFELEKCTWWLQHFFTNALRKTTVLARSAGTTFKNLHQQKFPGWSLEFPAGFPPAICLEETLITCRWIFTRPRVSRPTSQDHRSVQMTLMLISSWRFLSLSVK